MPDFTFTSPEGKNYTVTGPEGATKEQAFQILQQQIQSGTAKEEGGASSATGKPNMQSPQMSEAQGAQPSQAAVEGTMSGKQMLKNTAIGGAAGGAIGALSPEILTGAGLLAEKLPGPVAKGVGGAMLAAGEMMEGKRGREAVIGALSGLAGTGAEQIALQKGASPMEAATVGLVGGIAGPAVGSVVAKGMRPFFNLAQSLLEKAGVGTGKSAVVDAARDKLSSLSNQPQLDLHAAIAKGANADKAAAEKAAQDHIATAQARADAIQATDQAAADKIRSEAWSEAKKIRDGAAERYRALNEASKGKLATAARVQALADKELAGVGKPAELSDIGSPLRDRVVSENKSLAGQRDAEYQKLKQARDAEVQANEQAGKNIQDLPEAKELVAEIDRRLNLTNKGIKASGGKDLVRDPTTRKAYEDVREALVNRRVQTGVDPETGAPKYATLKTTFEAIDQVRRKVGDAAFGTEKEGYGALGQTIAKDLYGKLSQIQEAYAPTQRALQDSYHAGSEPLAQFGAKAGKKIVGTDRMDGSFLQDPSSIPKSFFQTRDSYRDLVSLTGGDVGLVEQSAKNYVAKNLQGKSAAQAQSWLKGQSDWMREVPGLQKSSADYVRKLDQIERVNSQLGAKAKALQSERSQVLPQAEKEANKIQQQGLEEASKRISSRVDERQTIMDDAQKQAATRVSDAQKTADSMIRSSKFPADAAKDLLLTGTPEQLRSATKYLSGEPGGKKILDAAVRRTLRDMSPTNVLETWQNRIKPMLEEGNLVPLSDRLKLERDVKRLYDSRNGPKQVNAIQRLITATLTSSSGLAASNVAGDRSKQLVE